MISKTCSRLRSLFVKDCSYIDDEGIKALYSWKCVCRETLTDLDITGTQISFHEIQKLLYVLPSLRRLYTPYFIFALHQVCSSDPIFIERRHLLRLSCVSKCSSLPTNVDKQNVSHLLDLGYVSQCPYRFMDKQHFLQLSGVEEQPCCFETFNRCMSAWKCLTSLELYANDDVNLESVSALQHLQCVQLHHAQDDHLRQLKPLGIYLPNLSLIHSYIHPTTPAATFPSVHKLCLTRVIFSYTAAPEWCQPPQPDPAGVLPATALRVLLV